MVIILKIETISSETFVYKKRYFARKNVKLKRNIFFKVPYFLWGGASFPDSSIRHGRIKLPSCYHDLIMRPLLIFRLHDIRLSGVNRAVIVYINEECSSKPEVQILILFTLIRKENI